MLITYEPKTEITNGRMAVEFLGKNLAPAEADLISNYDSDEIPTPYIHLIT